MWLTLVYGSMVGTSPRRSESPPRPPDPSNGGGVPALDDDQLHLAGAGPPKRGRGLILGGAVAGHRLVERRELDDHEALEVLRTLEDPVAASSRQDLPLVSCDDRRDEIGVPLVLHWIVDLRASAPIDWHGRLLRDR